MLNYYADTGADVLEVDHKVNLEYAKATIGDRTCLLGNVDPVSPLLLGTPEEVFDVAGDGYMLGTGCMVSRNTPLENVQALVAAARRHENRGDESPPPVV